MRRVSLFVLYLLLIILHLSIFPSQAQTLTVTDTSPYVNANGACSMVEAIINANDDAATHADCPAGAGADNIILSSVISLDGSTLFPASSPIFFDPGNSGLPEITSDITITGGGLTRASATPFRFFVVLAAGSLTLEDMSIQNGSVVGDCNFTGTPAIGCGGAIVSDGGTVILSNTTFSGNSSSESVAADIADGGAIKMFGGNLTISESTFSNNTAEYGGAISVAGGTLSITDASFTSNTSILSGGAIFQVGSTNSTIVGTSFTGNQVTSIGFLQNGGGAIDNAGSNTQLTVVNSTFTGNSAPNAGAINNANASDATIVNSTFTNNSATNGGAIANRGSGATVNVYSSTITGNTASVGAGISNGGTSDTGIANIVNSSISSNTATGDGGGIFTRGNLTVINSVLADNSGQDGGGISVGSGSGQTVTVESTTVEGNFASGDGGGLYYTENPSGTVANLLMVTDSVFDQNESDQGGGIYAARTDVDILRTTLSNNLATNIGFGGGGGALFNSVSVVSIENSTISGNNAQQDGSGLYFNNGTTATISNSTIAFNSNDSVNGADGIHSLVAIADVVVSDTIVANNGNRNCIDISAFLGVTDGGNNISSDTTCRFGDTGSVGIGDGVDPLLAALANNGGNTNTHALQAGSPALDTSSGACPATDQRGAGRINNCDIGAFEGITSIADVTLSVDETILYEVSGTVATITVTLDNTQADAQDVSITVPLRVTGDASGVGFDYVQSNQNNIAAAQAGLVNSITLTALSGQVVTETFTITAVDDSFVELDELVNITASVIGNAAFGGANTLALTIISDDVAPIIPPVINNGNDNDSNDGDETTTDDSGSPNIGVFDPSISKLGLLQPGELGVVGEKLRWDVTVVNNGTEAGINVVIRDTLRSELSIDRVTTSKGQVSVSGQTVTVTIPILNAGEQVSIAIFTTSLDGAIVANTACVTADNQSGNECASALPISVLPSTGQSVAWWRRHEMIALMIGFALMVLVVLGVYSDKRAN